MPAYKPSLWVHTIQACASLESLRHYYKSRHYLVETGIRVAPSKACFMIRCGDRAKVDKNKAKNKQAKQYLSETLQCGLLLVIFNRSAKWMRSSKHAVNL